MFSSLGDFATVLFSFGRLLCGRELSVRMAVCVADAVCCRVFPWTGGN